MNRKIAFFFTVILMGAASWLGVPDDSPIDGDPGVSAAIVADRIDGAGATLAERTGSTFLPMPDDPYRSPRVRIIPVPEFPGADAIWGSTGRDRHGHIWFGVSASGGDHSAHLFEYDPERDEMIDRGDVVSNLKAAGLHRKGERQVKIHSRIVQADDGYLYFSSTDEEGEQTDGSAPPTWGSHLWRLYPGDNRWEHLHWVREGLTAVAGGGRWVYALGLWDHVLYQYDTLTGAIKRVTVGSVGGHMSRNIIADLRGHVFVPRVSGDAVALVEFDPSLREIGTTPLHDYLTEGRARQSHGITGLVYLADGSMVISIHGGVLYRIMPQNVGPSFIIPLGYFDPQDPNYAPSLFTFAGERFLVGVARRKKDHKDDRQGHVWLVLDLESGLSKRVNFPLEGKALLYGSITRDMAGRFYAVGRHENPESGRLQPLILQLDTRG